MRSSRTRRDNQKNLRHLNELVPFTQAVVGLESFEGLPFPGQSMPLPQIQPLQRHPAGPARWIDVLIEALLISLLAIATAWFGGVLPAAHQWMVAWVTLILVCWLVRLLIQPHCPVVWTWHMAPIAGFALLVLVQLIPLPLEGVFGLTPGATAIRADLLHQGPGPHDPPAHAPLSLYPHSTVGQLRLVLMLGALFVVIVNVYRRPEQIERLLWAMAIIGLAAAILLFLQQSGGFGAGTGAVYAWFTDLRPTRGPMVGKGPFSQLVNLSIGAMVGLALLQWQKIEARGHVLSAAMGVRHFLWTLRSSWLLAAMALAGVVAVILSESRGGAVSLLMAGSVITGAMIATSGRTGAGWVLGGVGVVMACVVMGFGLGHVDRLILALRHPLTQSGVRPQMFVDTLIGWTHFPLLGAGLGTYETVFPQFDRSGSTLLATHAENEYTQTLFEVGLLGLALVLAFVSLVARSAWRVMRNPRLPIAWGAFGLGMGLVAVMIHSLGDFGQHMPAVAMFSACSCGLLVALDRLQAAAAPLPATAAGFAVKPVFRTSAGTTRTATARVVALLVVLGIGAWGFQAAQAARLADAQWRLVQQVESRIVNDKTLTNQAAFDQLMHHVQAAVDHAPTNAYYRYKSVAYQWYWWQGLDQNGQAQLDQAQWTRLANGWLTELGQVCEQAPTFGRAWALAGQLHWQVLGDHQTAAKLVERAQSLSPHRREVHLAAALLAVEQQRWDDSLASFQLADARRLALSIYLDVVHRPDLAIALVDTSHSQLLSLANRLDRHPQHRAWAPQARRQARQRMQQLGQHGRLNARDWHDLAQLHDQADDREQAVAALRQALVRQYDQANWRMQLAQWLLEAGQTEQAVDQARIVLRLQPNNRHAQDLIARPIPPAPPIPPTPPAPSKSMP